MERGNGQISNIGQTEIELHKVCENCYVSTQSMKVVLKGST